MDGTDRQHFELSPSAAHRWMRCPGSIALSRGIEDVSSAAADEGTLAHEIAAAVLLEPKFRHKVAKHPAVADLGEDNVTPLQSYVDYVLHKSEGNLRYIEVALDLSWWLGKGGFGTSDTVIYVPSDRLLKVIDLKFGRGHMVFANEKSGDELRVNPQLGLYGLGAYNLFNMLDIDEIELTIHQPRRAHVSTMLITPDRLIAFGEEVKGAVKRVSDYPMTFSPGEKQCQWCPARATCAARSEWHVEAFAQNISSLTEHEVARLLEQVSDMRAWCDDLETYAYRALTMKAGSIPGWKLVAGRSMRQWTADAGMKLLAAGIDPYDREPRLLGVGKIEKMLGAGGAPLMAKITVKGQGKPTLVRDSDPRNALDDAVEGFSTETGETA